MELTQTTSAIRPLDECIFNVLVENPVVLPIAQARVQERLEEGVPVVELVPLVDRVLPTSPACAAQIYRQLLLSVKEVARAHTPVAKPIDEASPEDDDMGISSGLFAEVELPAAEVNPFRVRVPDPFASISATGIVYVGSSAKEKFGLLDLKTGDDIFTRYDAVNKYLYLSMDKAMLAQGYIKQECKVPFSGGLQVRDFFQVRKLLPDGKPSERYVVRRLAGYNKGSIVVDLTSVLKLGRQKQ